MKDGQTPKEVISEIRKEKCLKVDRVKRTVGNYRTRYFLFRREDDVRARLSE